MKDIVKNKFYKGQGLVEYLIILGGLALVVWVLFMFFKGPGLGPGKGPGGGQPPSAVASSEYFELEVKGNEFYINNSKVSTQEFIDQFKNQNKSLSVTWNKATTKAEFELNEKLKQFNITISRQK